MAKLVRSDAEERGDAASPEMDGARATGGDRNDAVPASPDRRVRKRTAGAGWLAFARWSLLVTIAVLPLLFAPWLRGLLVTTQQTLVIAGVTFALLGWIVSALASGTLVLPRLPKALLAIAGALVVAVLVVVASAPARRAAFWGVDGADVDTALPLLLGVIIAILIPTILRTPSELRRGIRALTGGILLSFVPLLIHQLALLITGRSPFGTTAIAFNAIGALGVYAAVFGIALFLGYRHDTAAVSFVRRILRAIAIIVPLIVLAVVGHRMVLAALAVGMAVLLALWFLAHREEVTQRVLELNGMLAVLFIAVLLLLSGLRIGSALGYPVEVFPTHRSSAQIVGSVFTHDLRAPFVGRGPGTYVSAYNAYRPLALNQTPFGVFEFRQSAGYWWTLLPTFGVVVTALLLAFVLGAFVVAMQSSFARAESGADRRELHALIASSAYAFLALSLAPTSTVALVLSFALLGLLAAAVSCANGRSATYAIFRTPQRAFFGSLLLTGVLVGGMFFLVVAGKRYASAVALDQSARVLAVGSGSPGAREAATREALRAHRTFPTDVSARVLGQLSFMQLTDELRAVTKENADTARGRVQALLQSTLQFAREATALRPFVHEHWAFLGQVYQSAIGVVQDSDTLALDAFSTARAWHPTTAAYPIAVAMVRIAQVDQKLVESGPGLTSAITDLEEALRMQPDSPDALLALAQVYERQGKLDDAIARTRAALQRSPNQVGILFALGALEYKRGNDAAARDAFTSALRIAPNYANARYFLGLIAERAGRRDEALQHFDAIREFNPDNAELKAKIDALRAAPTTPQ